MLVMMVMLVIMIMIMIMKMKMKMDVAPWCYKWDWMDGTGYIRVGWAV